MNRDELDRRNTAAVTHWWTTMRDSGRVEPGLLSDLAEIAGEHAEDAVVAAVEANCQLIAPLPAAASEHAPARSEPHTEAATPPLVAADLPGITPSGDTTGLTDTANLQAAVNATRTIPSSPSSRTRTRTRGGPK